MRPRGPGWRARRLGCWVCRGAPQELSLEHKRVTIHRILACHRFLQRRKLSCGRFFQCIGEIEIYAQKGAIGDYSHEYDSAPTAPAGPTRPGTAAPSVLTRREPPHNPQGARKCRTVALLNGARTKKSMETLLPRGDARVWAARLRRRHRRRLRRRRSEACIICTRRAHMAAMQRRR